MVACRPQNRATTVKVAALVAGPAILEQADTTTLIPPGWAGTVIAGGNILIEPVKEAGR